MRHPDFGDGLRMGHARCSTDSTDSASYIHRLSPGERAATMFRAPSERIRLLFSRLVFHAFYSSVRGIGIEMLSIGASGDFALIAGVALSG